MKEQIISILKKNPFLSLDELLKKCSFLKGFEGKKLRAILEEMVDEGSVIMTSRGKFALGINVGIMSGKIVGNSKGFAFFEPTGEKEDFFIAERNLNGACHGDTVLCKELPKRRGESKKHFASRREAEVVKIEKRGIIQVVGTLIMHPAGNIVIPDDKRFTDQIFLDKFDNTVPQNSKVVVKILDYPSRTQMCRGTVIEVLGDSANLKVSTLSVIRSFNLIETFPESVQENARQVAVPITEKDLKGREDFRKDLVITIDGEDARDFDDAISLTKTKDGLYRLSVHIADVTHYVKQNSPLDQEAYRRATSVYFPDWVLPMLPVELSNNMCSLMEGEDRLTLSVVMDINNVGEVVNSKICNGVIHSSNRMTYTKVSKILDGDEEMKTQYAHLVPMLEEMVKLTEILIAKRARLGSIDFDLPETKFELDKNYEVVGVNVKPRTLADRLIEQFMVTTNEVVATFCCKNNFPFIYRVHESPLPEKMKAFNDFIKTFDPTVRLPIAEIKPIEVQEFLKTLKGKEYESVINKVMLRTMQKALYFEKCNGHFGLASKFYCHFTSPIRRYPDLVIHRIIKSYLAGDLKDKTLANYEDFVAPAAEHSSEMEQLADTAERAVDDLKKAEYMKKHIGEEFEGICNGVSDAGVFVLLNNTCEGLIEKDTLPKDNYVWEAERYRLIGRHHKYQLGDKLKIKMREADLVTRRCLFDLTEQEKVAGNGLQSSTMTEITHKKRYKDFSKSAKHKNRRR